ncbi:MAG: hypothetical protein WCF67_20090 [Chitinophagaceae bacterium]
MVVQPGGGGAAMAFGFVLFPAIWLIAFVMAMGFFFLDRKVLLKKKMIMRSMICIFFCTPIPFLLAFNAIDLTRNAYLASTTIAHRNNKIYKSEYWNYTSGTMTYALKHFVADSLEEISIGEKAFIKDSTWIYFDESGDTLKIEHYKAGKLISK